MKQIFTTTLRLNLDCEADRKALVRLRLLDKKKYRSYSEAIVVAINEMFDRQEQLANDAYLETREKEDAFLAQCRSTIHIGQ